MDHLCGALCVVPVFYLLYVNLMNSVAPAAGSGIIGYIASLPLMGKLLFGTFLLGRAGILIWSFVAGSRTEFQMMLAAMVLIVFNVVFWTLFEQAGSSLTLFADRNTNLLGVRAVQHHCAARPSSSTPPSSCCSRRSCRAVDRAARSAGSSRRSPSSSASR